MKVLKNKIILLCTLVLGISLPSFGVGVKPTFVQGQVLCQLYHLKDTSEFNNYPIPFKYEVVSAELNIVNLHFDPNLTDEHTLIANLSEKYNTLIQHIQLNHRTYLRSQTPNDSSYSSQQVFWNLVKAPNAWSKTTGGLSKQGDTIVIAMIDDGIDTSHSDIQKNLWRNHAEIPNDGIDNDSNGYIDDYYGWNSYDSSGNMIEQFEKARHGTPVGGLIAADGNNQEGVTGANWNVKIMTVVGGSENEAKNIEAFEYILKQKKLYLETKGKKGAYIVSANCSWGIGGVFPKSAPLWCAFYDSLGAYGITTVAATDKRNADVEQSGDLPSLCESEHLVIVTNVNATNDTKVDGAAYSKTYVDLGAPGNGTFTLCAQNSCGSPYKSFSGTSAASPVVCGLYGLIYNYACDSFISLSKTAPALASKLASQWILEGVDSNASLKDITVTGGRVNYEKALNNLENWCHAIGQPVGIENAVATNHKVLIYPNPSSGEVNITSVNNINNLKIYTLDGKLLTSKNFLDKELKLSLDLQSGIYIFMVTTENQEVNPIKVVVTE